MATCDRCGPYVEAAFRFLNPENGHELTLCSHCTNAPRGSGSTHGRTLRAHGWMTYRLVRESVRA